MQSPSSLYTPVPHPIAWPSLSPDQHEPLDPAVTTATHMPAEIWDMIIEASDDPHRVTGSLAHTNRNLHDKYSAKASKRIVMRSQASYTGAIQAFATVQTGLLDDTEASRKNLRDAEATCKILSNADTMICQVLPDVDLAYAQTGSVETTNAVKRDKALWASVVSISSTSDKKVLLPGIRHLQIPFAALQSSYTAPFGPHREYHDQTDTRETSNTWSQSLDIAHRLGKCCSVDTLCFFIPKFFAVGFLAEHAYNEITVGTWTRYYQDVNIRLPLEDTSLERALTDQISQLSWFVGHTQLLESFHYCSVLLYSPHTHWSTHPAGRRTVSHATMLCQKQHNSEGQNHTCPLGKTWYKTTRATQHSLSCISNIFKYDSGSNPTKVLYLPPATEDSRAEEIKAFLTERKPCAPGAGFYDFVICSADKAEDCKMCLEK
jgi:hypothetical protein